MSVQSQLFARYRGADFRPALTRRVELALLVLLGVQTGRLLWLLLPATPVGIAATAAEVHETVIPATDLFYRSQSLGVSSADASGYTLHGVRLGSLGGSAILRDASGKQQSWLVGETIDTGLVLASVGAGFATLKDGGMTRRLDMPAPVTATAAAPAVATPSAVLPASASHAAGASASFEPAALLAQAGLSPNEQGGYTVNPRGDATLLTALGLQAGDVVRDIDGQPLDAEMFIGLQEQLSTTAVHSLTVVRNGQTLTVTLPKSP